MGQTISATQFFIYGKRHFTQTGYRRHVQAYDTPAGSNALDKTDGIDLTGKSVVVTGANSGLGKEVATYVAARNGTIYMVCRSKERAEVARKAILESTKATPSNVKIVACDVGDLDQVRAAVKEISGEIHCLVCNAGALLHKQQSTPQGFETTFASHLLGGTYLLTNLLLPQLRNNRVVVVTSGGMYNTPLPDWKTLTAYSKEEQADASFKYDGTMAYAYAKRGQVLLVEEWAKQHSDTTFCTVHPGWSGTPGVDDALSEQKKYLQPLRTPWEGAEGVCWLVSAKNIESGELYLDRTPQRKHLGGPFFTQGSFTKNSPEQVASFMDALKEAAGM